MRKLIFIFIFSMLVCFSSFCQLMENGDFSINGGNIPTSGCFNISSLGGTAPAIAEGAVFPNWHITHGSPNFDFFGNSPYPNDIYLYGDKGLGEGIAGGYNFMAGKKYRINIGLRAFSNPSAIKIALVKGAMPFTTDCDLDRCYLKDAYQGIVPNVPNGNIVHILPDNYEVGDNCFTVSLTNDYNWIWIYVDTDECDDSIQLFHIFISPVCEDVLYLSQVSIPNVYYTGYKRILAGSVYGPNSLTTSTLGTYLEASQLVILDHNFSAEGVRRRPFIAGVNPLSCDNCGIVYKPGMELSKNDNPLSYSTNYNNSKITLIRNQSQILRKEENLCAIIKPNPSTGKFTVKLNIKLNNAKIMVYNTYGKLIFENNFSGNIVDFNISDFPSGMYFINIIEGNKIINKKIIKY